MTFFQEPTKLNIKGTDVLVAPLKVKQISQAAKCSAPLIAALSGGKVNPITIMENSDSVIELCALATNQSAEWVGELDLAELLQLVTAVIEQNSSFFFQAAFPAIQNLIGVVGGAAQKAQMIGKEA